MRLFVITLGTIMSSVALTPLSAQVRNAGDSVTTQDSVRNRNAFTLSPILVTATVEPTPENRIGFASSVVITPTSLAPAPSAARTLRRLPDVFIDEAAGPGGPAVLRIRGGEETYTKVLSDGVPINISGGFLDIQ